MASFVLKVYDSTKADIYRTTVNVPSLEEFTFGQLCEVVHNLVPKADLARLKWEDPEKELIVVRNDEHLKEAVRCMPALSGGSLLKIHVICPVVVHDDAQPIGLPVLAANRVVVRLNDLAESATVRHLRQRLLFLLHAKHCQHRQCIFQQCDAMTSVLDHLAVCKGPHRCRHLYCHSSRRLIEHWKKCKQQDCLDCLTPRSEIVPESDETRQERIRILATQQEKILLSSAASEWLHRTLLMHPSLRNSDVGSASGASVVAVEYHH